MSSISSPRYWAGLSANQWADQSRVIPSRNPTGCTLCPNLCPLVAYNDGDVTVPLVHIAALAAGHRHHAPELDSFVRLDLDHPKPVRIELVVILRICRRSLDRLG